MTVLGLGEMGSALAAAFLAAGRDTTVWNRTPSKAESLVGNGAKAAAEAPDAIAAGDLVIVSVKGNAAARALLEAGDLTGRTVVNLTDGTSAEIREVAESVAARGARYVHGQIMTIAVGIGHAEAVIFFGGDQRGYDDHKETLDLLGGKGKFIAIDPAAPALYGMAVHGVMWGMLNGFLHSAALLSDAGVSIEGFLGQADDSMSALLGFLPSLATDVDSGSYAVEFGALKHHLPSILDLMRESEQRGIDTAFPGYTKALVENAIAAGGANDNYSRLVEHFRG